ncbi:Cupin domain-containing protein [Pseudomonas flavescens]|uniref:Cupin domain-containing protein n=1 Tax=Phytopseudomonas flavescens TaxID=29435 RepID=A0A1G7X9J2_9GAMM|nr:cupin domain-containing protein [Pseudomonas flavescens]SDG80250.1 Cupin domain-containing protein [Pseudomonas flavescens]
MQLRRIVTGHDEQGRSVFVEDGQAPRANSFQDIPGYSISQVWATRPECAMSEDLTREGGSMIPGPGGTSLLVVHLPPDAVMAAPLDAQRAAAEMSRAMPGLIDIFEPDDPAMHRSATLDYGLLLEGELWLELDDGEQRLLRPGDVVIQQGTRHAWRNRSQTVAKAVFFMVGAVPSAR